MKNRSVIDKSMIINFAADLDEENISNPSVQDLEKYSTRTGIQGLASSVEARRERSWEMVEL